MHDGMIPDLSAMNLDNMRYCGHCYLAFDGPACPECQQSGQPAQADDPIYLGELPHALRNAFQIAFQATEIPFTAMPTLGAGFTLSAGDIFETYKVYVPLERSAEARETFSNLFKEEEEEEEEEEDRQAPAADAPLPESGPEKDSP